jgi:hypothetical protein
MRGPITDTTTETVTLLIWSELRALRRARCNGWLEVTSDIRDIAIEHWQQECQRERKVFALSRPEGKRTSIWLILPEGWCWNQTQRNELATSSLEGAKGILFRENSVRAFVPPGSEVEIFGGLLRAIRAEQFLHLDRRPSSEDSGGTALRQRAATRARAPLLQS